MKNRLILLGVLVSVLHFSKHLQANVLSESWLRADRVDSSLLIKEPKPLDWKNFFLLNDLEKSALWNKAVRQAYVLPDWHWQWRLAWIKSCDNNNINHCHAILDAGLKDRAAVVRAAAAAQYGRLFEKSNDLEVVEKLKQAYLFKVGQKKQPDFVKKRIIFALTRILNDSEQLSAVFSKDKMGLAYLQKIQRSNKKSTTANF